jgi:hypothetical protein
MLLKQVKVLKATRPSYWYAKHIGEVFVVYYNANTYSKRYIVLQEGVFDDVPTDKYLDADDVEVIDILEADICQTVNIELQNIVYI